MKPMSYLDLVVATVRGQSPVPEFSNFKVDRSKTAKEYSKKLKEKHKGKKSGSYLLDMVLQFGAPLLRKSWDKMSPAALSMCGEQSVSQLLEALETVHKEKIPGNFIETGVWRGGLPLIMRAFLQSVGDKERKVYLADSFQGLPDDLTDPMDKVAHKLLEPIQHLATSRKQVEAGFDFFGLKDEQVIFLEGWFKDTLPKLGDQQFAIARLDGDYYESTRDAIVELYPKLSVGGYLIVDDYNLPVGCKRAINEYREMNGITERIIKINKQAIYWRKEK